MSDGGVGVATEWELREVIGRCISLIVAHHEDDWMPEAEAMMAAQMETIAAWVEGMDLGCGDTDRLLGCGDTDRLILEPIEGELVARYGWETGGRLHAEFIEAFEVAGCRLYAESVGASEGLPYVLAS
jgi:hypothetical protein